MNNTLLLKLAAILWVIWGVVHAFAGILVMSSDTTGAVQAIADGVEPALLALEYPAASGAIINQHGWNLAWFGFATIIGAVFIWRESATAIFVTAMVGGLADLGYFIFLDLGSYVNFVPGTVMTIFSSLAIALSFISHFKKKKE